MLDIWTILFYANETNCNKQKESIYMSDYMDFNKLENNKRKAIVDVGKRMYEHGLVVTNDGNISVRLSEDRILVTPTGVSKGHMTEQMLVLLDLEGTVIAQGGREPSSEVKMHLRVYQDNPEIKAVVHAHPLYATSFGIAGLPLDSPILSEAMLQIGAVPIAHYAEPGTYEVPDSIAPYVKDYGAVLLSNHGALTWGSDLEEAYARMEVVEQYAHISFIVHELGTARELSHEQVEGLAHIRERSSLKPVVMPRGRKYKMNNSDILPEFN